MKIFRLIKSMEKREKPLKFLVGIFLIKLNVSYFFKIKMKDYFLSFYPTALSLTLWLDAKARNEDETFFESYLRKGDNVIDVGANIGSLTLKAASLIKNGKVFAIEPHPQIYKYLVENIKLNNFDNIECFKIIAGNENQLQSFSDVKSDDQNSVRIDDEGIKLRQQKIDDFIDNELEFALIKIDVEGYEKFVILGAKNVLKKTKCVYFEASDKLYKNYQYTYQDIFTLLTSLGFTIFKIQENKIIKVTDSYSPIGENLLAIKNTDEFLDRTKLTIIE